MDSNWNCSLLNYSRSQKSTHTHKMLFVIAAASAAVVAAVAVYLILCAAKGNFTLCNTFQRFLLCCVAAFYS